MCGFPLSIIHVRNSYSDFNISYIGLFVTKNVPMFTFVTNRQNWQKSESLHLHVYIELNPSNLPSQFHHLTPSFSPIAHRSVPFASRAVASCITPRSTSRPKTLSSMTLVSLKVTFMRSHAPPEMAKTTAMEDQVGLKY